MGKSGLFGYMEAVNFVYGSGVNFLYGSGVRVGLVLGLEAWSLQYFGGWQWG